ncbi:MAG: CDP-diacylglycerol--glycerol-3-phosphate 3-phosphatidyltransferase [Aurantimicrobium sp.]|nr:CDP-diacylglycerol--glycerol-3-phosphate 3-phosphatidyltransferase [Aurantimicrobium minutum]MDH6208170.1 CDP-diacylglycerol--glycerol-3-phosphate 3-phosphatidyltransferase [Aurantimicrobium minutum]MDH6409367.1 CDP-diacylglycerol--glycerol-3-phosphate 3-phosphatidyltransferase [Aurantimicrobium minutum]
MTKVVKTPGTSLIATNVNVMKHVPNTITIVRIFFAPVFIWMLLTAGDDLTSPLRWWGAGLFVFGMATDGIDGYLARKYNVVSDFGKLLDPIADKVLTGGALITLSILDELPWWVTAVILLREVGITVFRFAVLSDRVIPASRGGKLKTITQFVAITFALLPMQAVIGDSANIINIVLMSAATIITVWTGIDYLVDAWRQNKKHTSKA